MKKFKKILTTLCVMVMVCFLALPFVACNDKEKNPTPPNPTPPQPEQETHYYDNDPKAVVIKTYDEFKAFIQDVRENDKLLSEIGGIEDGYVVFANDIDCGGDTLDPIISQDLYGINYVIDGDGHTIKNFKLDKTKAPMVQATGGSSQSGFKVVALFPLFQGGTLKNITFENVEIDLDLAQSEPADYHVGIVGYAASSGVNNGEVQSGNVCSTFKDITIKDMKVTAKAVETTTSGKYPLSIGALVGLDSDSTEVGSTLTNTSTTMATRENIKVENFQVDVTKATGTVFVGGVAGQTHYTRTTYKNCNVDAKVNVTSTGTTVPESLAAGNLGDLACVGGIFGANQKDTYEFFVDSCDVKLECKFNNEHYRVGKVSGLVLDAAKSAVPDTLHEVHVTALTATVTAQVNEEAATSVTKDYETA